MGWRCGDWCAEQLPATSSLGVCRGSKNLPMGFPRSMRGFTRGRYPLMFVSIPRGQSYACGYLGVGAVTWGESKSTSLRPRSFVGTTVSTWGNQITTAFYCVSHTWRSPHSPPHGWGGRKRHMPLGHRTRSIITCRPR